MTIFSTHTAIVGLGTSCQTSTQIKYHIDLLRLALRDKGLEAASSSMFDFLIAPMSSVTSLLESGCDHTRLVRDSVVYTTRPRWQEHGIVFWHDAFDPEKIAAKYRHLLRKFEDLRSIERLIFVISNTQPNLEQIGFAEPVTLEMATALMRATDSYFRRACEYLFILNPKHGDLPHRFANARSYAIEDIGRNWQVNSRAWEIVFRQHFAYYDKVEGAGRDSAPALQGRHPDLLERYAVLKKKYQELRERGPNISAL